MTNSSGETAAELRHALAPTAEPVDGTVEVDRVPVADGCDDQVEPGGAVLLVKVRSAMRLRCGQTRPGRGRVGPRSFEPGGSAGAARGSPASRGEERALEPPEPPRARSRRFWRL